MIEGISGVIQPPHVTDTDRYKKNISTQIENWQLVKIKKPGKDKVVQIAERTKKLLKVQRILHLGYCGYKKTRSTLLPGTGQDEPEDEKCPNTLDC